jgi:hypothetical protein
MNTLRKLTSIITLSLMLGLHAFACETQTPPGETQTPPWQSAANGDPGDSNTSATPSGAGEVLIEITAEVLKDILSIL